MTRATEAHRLRMILPMRNVSSEQVLERLMVGLSGCALLGGIAIVNDSMRSRFTGVVSGTAASELSAGLGLAQRIGGDVMRQIGYASNEHTTLFFFGISAVVLFFLTLRT